jgi:hypothetical protein
VNMYQWTAVIFLSSLVVMLAAAWWTGRDPRPRQQPPPPPTPARELPRAGLAEWPTLPDILPSVEAARFQAFNRDVEYMIARSFELIGPVSERSMP